MKKSKINLIIEFFETKENCDDRVVYTIKIKTK